METNEKLYRYSLNAITFPFFTYLVITIPFLFFADFVFNVNRYVLFSLAGLGFILLLSFYLTKNIRISDDEILSSSIFGLKIIGWDEIGDISIENSSMKLVSDDSNITLLVDSRLKGYSKILDLILSRHGKLLDKYKSNMIFSGFHWINDVVVPLLIYIFFVYWLNTYWYTSLLGLAALLLFLVPRPLSPKSVTLKKHTLQVLYLFSKHVSYSIHDIDSIALVHGPSKDGCIVRIDLKNGKSMKLSGFKPDNVTTYLTLKRWYKDAISI